MLSEWYEAGLKSLLQAAMGDFWMSKPEHQIFVEALLRKVIYNPYTRFIPRGTDPSAIVKAKLCV
jgi:hypothetical protein